MSVRVYVPCTMSRLQVIVTADGIGPAPFVAHAVTDAVREALPDGGEEDWEYAASSAASLSSVGLLGADEPARRVVVAVNVPSVRSVEVEDPTVVEVVAAVPLRWVAAVLADTEDAERDVAAARAADAAESPDAARLLERCLDHELGWWAAQEVTGLLGSTRD